MKRSICTIGTGYVGMASMIGLAELGWTVNGYDIMTDRIRKLQSGIAPYREAGIEEALAAASRQRPAGVLRIARGGDARSRSDHRRGRHAGS